MILPEGDISWLNTINSLILVQETVEILRRLYGSDSAYVETTEAGLKNSLQLSVTSDQCRSGFEEDIIFQQIT